MDFPSDSRDTSPVFPLSPSHSPSFLHWFDVSKCHRNLHRFDSFRLNSRRPCETTAVIRSLVQDRVFELTIAMLGFTLQRLVSEDLPSFIGGEDLHRFAVF